MDNIGSRFDFCPVCGETFLVEQLNAHANSHFASPTASPSAPPLQQPTPEPDTEADALSLARLPTEASALVQVQTVETQFAVREDTVAALEGAYLSGRLLNNGRSVLCVSGKTSCH